MGGEIGVRSEVNVGSCFSFAIPLPASTRTSTRASTRSSVEPRLECGPLLEHLKVLVVQDNARIRAILQRDLDRWGAAAVITVETASEALTQWRHSIDRNAPFDLAIVDLNLLDMSGLELVQRLHQDPHFQSNPFAVLMLLPVKLPPLEQALSDLGIQTYLRKPFTPSSLHEALVSLLSTIPTSNHWADPLTPTVNRQLQAVSPRSPQIPYSSPTPIAPLTFPKLDRESQTRILLVEDNVINQAVAQGMIEQLGLKVEIASHGKEAIAMLAAADQRPYSLVLMDAQMPILDGYETTQQIRQGLAGERHRSVPIIALTAHALIDDRERCLQAGMDDYLSKPLHLKRLATVVEQWLGRVSAEWSKQADICIGTGIQDEKRVLPLFDSDGLLERAGGLLDLAQKMVQRFLEGIPSALEHLQQCLHQGDTTTIARMAHSLQGSTSMIGAEQMQAMLIHIETIACDRDLEALSEWIPKLEDHFSTLQTVLTAWLA
jgi:CheY-like chemotaxis protein/HPt (histidine-containing phosphotransfer) domain-containing protein